MKRQQQISLNCRFEKIPSGQFRGRGPIEKFGRLAGQQVQAAASFISNSAFGLAEKTADGLLDPGFIRAEAKVPPRQFELRIRSIEESSKPLVEYSYNREGQIAEVILYGSIYEKYAWSDRGQVLSITTSGSGITQFSYDKNGRLLSVTYPNRAVFKYSYSDQGELEEILYPDRVPVRYKYNQDGSISRVECANLAVEYLWVRSQVGKAVFRNQNLAWPIDVGKIPKQLNIDFTQTSDGPASSLSSALGLWGYDVRGNLCEMFGPSGERLVTRGTLPLTELLSWRGRGQSRYQIDESGCVMRVLNTNGQTAAYGRSRTGGTVYLASVFGVGALFYDRKGRLRAHRDELGRGVSYDLQRTGLGESLGIAEQRLSMAWTKECHLKSIEVGGFLNALISMKTQLPQRALIESKQLRTSQLTGAMNGFVWNWEALQTTCRLRDSSL